MNSARATHGVLSALRRPRDEAQLTQILAGFAESDAAFSSGLAQSFVRAAPRDDAVQALGPIPPKLECEAEHQAIDEAGADRGFVDLRFFNEAEGFTLLVELKLHSGYGNEQLERYLSALDPLPGRTALVAMTTWLPSYGEGVVAGDPRWLGSGRWAHAFDDMRELEHSDPTLRNLWVDLLDLLRKQGDFGVMELDVAAVEGWARWKQGREQLTALLDEIHAPTLDLLRVELAKHTSTAVSDELAAEIRHKGKRLVWPWGESLHVEYAVPTSNGGRERFRIQFLGGHDQLYFTVEARHENNRVMSGATDELRAATERLMAAGFTTGHYWGAYWSRAHPVSVWLTEGRVSESLMSLVEADVRELVSSGIFDALRNLPLGPSSRDEPLDGPDAEP